MPRIESKWATASADPGPKSAPTASKPGDSGDGSQRIGQGTSASSSPKDAASAPASGAGDSPSKRRSSHRGGRKHSKSDSSSKNGSVDRTNGEKLSDPVTPSKHADAKRAAEENSPAKVLQTSRWAVAGSTESSHSSPKADTSPAKHEGSPTKDRRKTGRRRPSETKASHDESGHSEGLSLANRLNPRSDKPTDSSSHLTEAPRAPAAVLNAPTEPAAERERRRRESRAADTTDRPRFSPHGNGHSGRGGHGRGHGHGRSSADEEYERRRRLDEERERNRAKKLQGPVPEWRRDPPSEAVHSQPTGYAAAASKGPPPRAPTQKPRQPAEPAAPAKEIDLKAFEEQIAALQTGSVDWADIDDE